MKKNKIPHTDAHTAIDTISALTEKIQKLLPPLLDVHSATLRKRKTETDLEPEFRHSNPAGIISDRKKGSKINNDFLLGNSKNQISEKWPFRDIPIPESSSRTYDSESSTVQPENYSEYFLRLDYSVDDEIPEPKNDEEYGNEENKSQDGNLFQDLHSENNEKTLVLVVHAISQIIRLNTNYEDFLRKLETEKNIRYLTILYTV